MQATQVDSALSQSLASAQQASDDASRLKLVIGNKNYSSWSMRPWVALTAFDIAFEEIRIPLDGADTATRIAAFSAAGRVPVLIDGKLTVWDSLAICEYAAEKFAALPMWPQDRAARAMARSICAEMHAGFPDLRSQMGMNIRASLPGHGQTPGAQADIGRICEIWETCLSHFGHSRFLFGDFSIADAFYAPVVMRFRTYGVSLAPALQAYAERVAAHPAVARWIADSIAESEVIAKYEPRTP
jgi:glutathione S-transferase